MIGIADFYLPVVLPPEKVLSNSLVYYSAIEAKGVKVTAAAQASGTPMEITVENAETLHADGVTPMSSVFAVTAGFVSYVQGDVVLRVWSPDYEDLVKPAGGRRPNRIVFGSLDAASVEAAAEKEIAKLPLPVLKESWTEAGGTGTVPDREALEKSLAQRFMAGTASIFVVAGTPLGTGSTSSGSDGTARLTLRTFFDPWGPAPPVSVPPEDLVDNAIAVLRLPKFAGHPLVKAISAAINVHFLSRFLIWDNLVHDYIPLVNTDVTLLASAPVPAAVADLIPSVVVAKTKTDGAGRINLTAPLPARAMISFQYATTSQTYGARLFTKDIETDAHKARLHLDASFKNTKDYKAKYEIFPEYQSFIDDIADQGDDEVFGEDRGNASLLDKNPLDIAAIVLPDFLEPKFLYSQRDLLGQISSFESFYKADLIPPKTNTFNLLVEGDSWLNYPLAFNDIYGHLDQIFSARLKPGIAYNRIPLQHLGDRSTQMFQTKPGKLRQWNFTEEFLREYQIDLILCSAGGNDVAEPGISNRFKEEPYKSFFTDGYFNPYWAQVSLSPEEMAGARKLMEQSFAVLLRNHLWNFYIRKIDPPTQMDEAAMTASLTPLLAAVGSDFGPSPDVLQALGIPPGPLLSILAPLVLQPIGEKVIANFPDSFAQGSPADALLHFIFDRTPASGSPEGLFEARYCLVKKQWENFLTKTKDLGIPVVSHTYGYPLFNESPASPLGWGNTNITGPWFNHRFREARITDRRIQKICLKAILDKFVNDVLEKLKGKPYSLFDYVDVRNLNSSTDLWRDEMHLKSTAYKKIAEKIYDVVAAHPKLSHFFVS